MSKLRFVGIGVGDYASGLPALASAESVRHVLSALGDDVDGDVLADLDDARIRAGLVAIKNDDALKAGSMVVMWSGHGIAAPGNGGVRLLARDSDADPVSGLSPADLVGPCVKSGVNQLLVIVDACYSGAALNASQLANWLIDQRADGGQEAWFGVMTSCRPSEKAADTVFANVLCAILVEGPKKDEDLRRRGWSPHNRMIRGDDLCEALRKEWRGDVEQLPQIQGNGSARGMISNPFWNPDAPPYVVEHLLLAARSGGDAAQSWFTGRTAEVNQAVAWVGSGEPGVHVITGLAGTGKSAVLGRVVSLSVESERQELQRQGAFGHADPGAGSVDAHAHARGRVPNQLARELAAQLGPLLRIDGDSHDSNVNELLGALERRATQSGDRWKPPVVVVDGLDEARGHAFAIASELLTRLGQWVTVIVSSRNLPSIDGGSDLVSTLAPVAVLDLGDVDSVQSSREAIGQYVVRRLDGVSDTMDSAVVAERFLNTTDAVHGQPFLLARLMTAQLREHAVDTTLAGWESGVSTSVGEAFDDDLTNVSAVDRAQTLLSALTWGVGAGLPEDVWLVVATAISPAGIELTRDDVSWLLATLGRYVVEDGEDGVAVYRIAHQALADHIRAPFVPRAETPFDPHALPVATAILDDYEALLESGVPATEPGYLWRYAWRHVSSAGLASLTRLEELAARWPELLQDVALANVEVSERLRSFGRHAEACRTSLVAVAAWRQLAAENPAHLPSLASALNNLGIRHGEVGHHHDALATTEEAVSIYRTLAAENPAHLPDLASALNNLGIRYGEVGHHHDALATTEEAVSIYRTLTVDNSRYLPALASALNNLGVSYSEVGRHHDALTPTEEAVTTYRTLTADNSRYLPDLASALNNLGIRYSDLGRHHDALTPTEEAVTTYRTLTDDNPRYLPDLASALNNLGIRYSDLGRHHDALTPTEEAVTTRRTLAAANPAHLPDLASSLNNLGVRYGQLGRHHDALIPTEEAVTIYRTLAADNPAHLPSLASALNNLGIRYGEVGRHHDALAPTEEAVTVRRALTADNPAHLPDLASALNNLGTRYTNLSRHHDALAPTEEAVTTRRALAADNPGYLPALASALNNLGVSYSWVGRHDDALAPTSEAVTTYRTLATDNPRYLPNLASALNNLGVRYSQLDRRHDALATTEEAVTTYRTLATDNPGYLPNLASALNNLGVRYSQFDRHHDALATTEEAVTTYRTLAADNPAHLRALAVALNNLEAQHGLLDDDDEFEVAWNQCLQALDPRGRIYVWIRRFQAAEAGDVRATRWLSTALADAQPLNGPALSAIHIEARRHRAADPEEFDRAWIATGQQDIPQWLRLDGYRLVTATSWVSTDTFEDERDWLASHLELLDSDADDVVEEALLDVGSDEANRYREIRRAAQSDGVESAYRPVFTRVLVDAFVHADLMGRRNLLMERAAELVHEDVRALLFEAVPDDDDTAVARCLIELLRCGSHLRVLDAMEGTTTFALVLADFASGDDISPLHNAATIAALIAGDATHLATANLYLSISSIRAGDDEAAAALATTATTLDADQILIGSTKSPKSASSTPSAFD